MADSTEPSAHHAHGEDSEKIAAKAEKTYPEMPLPEKRAWPALLALCIGFFMILLDQTIVAVATPELQVSMDATYNQVIWVTSVYLLTFAVPLLIAGRLGDRFGPKNVYVVGMALFTISSLACGLAPSMEFLIVARAAQGLGAALLTPQTMTVINRIFSIERRGAALGIWGTTAGLATLTGPILGGLITQQWGWQWVFYINVPIGVISILATLRYVPEFPPLTRPIDPLSIVLSVLALFSIVFALQEGQEAGWAPWIWLLLVLGALFLVWFVFQQKRAQSRGNDPLVPLEIFRNKNFSLGNIAIMSMGFTVAGTPLPLMMYFQQIHGLNPMHAGMMMIPQALLSAILSPIVGRLVDRTNPNNLAAFGFFAMTVSISGLATVMITDVPMVWIFLPMVGLGIGNGFVWAPNSTITMRDLPSRLMGAGSGVFNTTRQLGSVLGSATIGAVLQNRLAAGETGAAYGEAILLAAVMLSVGVVTSLVADDSSAAAARARLAENG